MYYGNCMTLRGKKHQQFNTKCQDVSGILISDRYAISVVADGHGGQEYVRSEVGARIAVESALEVLSTYLDGQSNCVKMVKNPDVQISKLEKKIEKKWKDEIRNHSKKHRLTTAERALVSNSNDKGRNPLIDYGTTLAVGVFCDGFSFCTYVGDSRIMVLSDYEVSTLLPLNAMCGYGTTSLCDDNVTFDHFYWNDSVPLAIACFSDGFSSRYRDNQVISNALGVLSVMDKKQYWNKSVANNLNNISSSGTGDDISISLIYHNELDHAKIYETNFGRSLPVRDDLEFLSVPRYKIQTGGGYKDKELVESGYWISYCDNLYYSDEIVNGVPNSMICVHDSYKYVGEIENYEKNGDGILSLNGVVKYKGQFKDGKYDGSGILYEPDNVRYEGDFSEGLKDGLGKIYSGDALTFEGTYCRGSRCGKGIIYHPTGEVEECEYKKGENRDK